MILILIGSSGSGKSSVAKKLIENHGYVAVKSCTTRDRREGETDDDYYFMTKSEFYDNIDAGNFAEYDMYGNNYYGTLKSELDKDQKLVCVLTPEGALAVQKVFPDAFIVQIGATMKTSVIRAIEREKELDPDKMSQISNRAILDYQLFKNPYHDFAIQNEDGSSVDDIARIIADAHEHCWDIKGSLKETNRMLKEGLDALLEYDKMKKAEEEKSKRFRFSKIINRGYGIRSFNVLAKTETEDWDIDLYLMPDTGNVLYPVKITGYGAVIKLTSDEETSCTFPFYTFKDSEYDPASFINPFDIEDVIKSARQLIKEEQAKLKKGDDE